MSFTDDQIASLKAPLDRAKVKSRAQAGRQLSYIEGWHAIAEANRIFGFDKWDRETVELRECGDPRQTGDKWRVAFMCRVRVKVRPANQMDLAWSVVRDGTGYGSGIDKDLGQAYESAIKEAETDAMKRALMTFGNPFGLALYDKDQANVADMRQQRQSDRHINEDAPEPAGPSLDEIAQQFVGECEAKIAAFTDVIALRSWWASADRKTNCETFQLSDEEMGGLFERVKARVGELQQRNAA